MEILFYALFVAIPIAFMLRPGWRKLNDHVLDRTDWRLLVLAALAVAAGFAGTRIPEFRMTVVAYLPVLVLTSGFVGAILFIGTMTTQFFDELEPDEQILVRMRAQIEELKRQLPRPERAEECAFLDELVDVRIPELLARKRATSQSLNAEFEALRGQDTPGLEQPDVGIARAKHELAVHELRAIERFLEVVETEMRFAKNVGATPTDLRALFSTMMNSIVYGMRPSPISQAHTSGEPTRQH